MEIRKIIERRIRRSGEGVDLAGDVNAVIAANVGERGSSTSASNEQHVVHRSRRTAVSASDEGGTSDEQRD